MLQELKDFLTKVDSLLLSVEVPREIVIEMNNWRTLFEFVSLSPEDREQVIKYMNFIRKDNQQKGQ